MIRCAVKVESCVTQRRELGAELFALLKSIILAGRSATIPRPGT